MGPLPLPPECSASPGESGGISLQVSVQPHVQGPPSCSSGTKATKGSGPALPAHVSTALSQGGLGADVAGLHFVNF